MIFVPSVSAIRCPGMDAAATVAAEIATNSRRLISISLPSSSCVNLSSHRNRPGPVHITETESQLFTGPGWLKTTLENESHRTLDCACNVAGSAGAIELPEKRRRVSDVWITAPDRA